MMRVKDQTVTHTPGPWTLGGLGIVLDAQGHAVQTAGPECPSDVDGSAFANARVIAAAPELLAACRWAVAVIDPMAGQEASDLSAACRAAIAKAEGTSR